MATAKFSSIRAEEVLVLGVLGFGKNGLDFRVREEATGTDVSVIYSDLFLEVEEMIEYQAKPLEPPDTEPMPVVCEIPMGWLLLPEPLMAAVLIASASKATKSARNCYLMSGVDCSSVRRDDLM